MRRRTFLAATLATSAFEPPARPAQTTPKPFVTKAGDARFGVHTPYRGVNANDVKVSGKDTNGQLAVFEYIGAEQVGPVLHVHHNQDEIFSIVEGEYLFQVGDERFTVKAGDTVFAPKGVPHTWIQVSERGRQVYMVQPAGQLEDLFLTLSALREPPTEELLQKLHQEHGMTVLGPPLALN